MVEVLCTILIVTTIFSIFSILILSSFNAADNLKNKAIKAYKDGDKIYINGSPVEYGFDLNGVNLDKYDIKLENDTVYKTKRESPRFL